MSRESSMLLTQVCKNSTHITRKCNQPAVHLLIHATFLQSLLTLMAMDSLISNMLVFWKTAPTAPPFMLEWPKNRLRILLSNSLTGTGKGHTTYLSISIHGCHGVHWWRNTCSGKGRNERTNNKESAIGTLACPWSVTWQRIGVWGSPSAECHDYKSAWSQTKWC